MAAAALQIQWVILIIGLVVVQWGLAMWALYRLFCNKPGKVKAILLNVMIVALVIVGPTGYLMWDFVKKRRKRPQGIDKAPGDEIK